MILLASLSVALSGLAGANVSGPMPDKGSGPGPWKTMRVNVKNGKARGYDQRRVKLDGAWYCWKESDTKVLKPRKVNNKANKKLTQATDFHSCGKNAYSKSHSVGNDACSYTYTESTRVSLLLCLQGWTLK